MISKFLLWLEKSIRSIKILSGGFDWLEAKISSLLTKEYPPPDFPINNYSSLLRKIKPADVVLIEGRSRVSDVIRFITQTQWSHSALYVGSMAETKDKKIRKLLQKNGAEPKEKYVVESLLGYGMILTPVASYADDNIRICRAKGLTEEDNKRVVKHVLRQLGRPYDVRQLLDLARFMFPFYGILPRRWRSSLFRHQAGGATKAVCSTAVAEAFMSVHFPILPIVIRKPDGSIRLRKRNPKLFVPRDFDYSPYFEIIKVPFVELPQSKFNFLKTQGAYHNLPWEDKNNIYCNDNNECFRVFTEDETETLNKEQMA